MFTRNIQSNFASGELSPKLRGRSDLQQYYNGLEKMTNMYPLIEGGAKRRPGLKFHYDLTAGGEAFLVDFLFNDDQTYILAFGNARSFRWGDGCLPGGVDESGVDAGPGSRHGLGSVG